MRIDHIHAQNYRTLRDVSISFTSNYCTLSGHNNAGKSCLVRLILNLLHDSDNSPWSFDDFSFSYGEDKTQWLKEQSPITVSYTLTVNKTDDSALIALLEKLTSSSLSDADTKITVTTTTNSDNESTSHVVVGVHTLDDVSRREFLSKLKSSDNLFLHNSTQNRHEYYMRRGRPTIIYDFFLSQQDRRSISDAENALQRKVKRVARDHKEALNSMLGRLNDRYDVEFSTLDFSMYRRVPLSINLRDKNVEVPLTNWGSGTQNRTHILLSILQANRIKTSESRENRITPIVLIEEPESFLHPSAQSEFGTVLQRLSEELSIQIIVSTHSPFMLNQANAQSNILLKRRTFRNKELEKVPENTSGDEWMRPFADHLGVIPDEFRAWRDVIANTKSRVLLVEGEIDKEYLSFLRTKFGDHFPLPGDVEIIAYGGKDALRNTTIVSFVRQIVGRVFVTFDLDAKDQVQRHLEQVGLVEKKDFAAIGLNRSGRRSIEGLLPDRVFQAVYGRETDLVSALNETGNERKSARSALKRKLLEEFKMSEQYTEEELRNFAQLGRLLSRAF